MVRWGGGGRGRADPHHRVMDTTCVACGCAHRHMVVQPQCGHVVCNACGGEDKCCVCGVGAPPTAQAAAMTLPTGPTCRCGSGLAPVWWSQQGATAACAACARSVQGDVVPMEDPAVAPLLRERLDTLCQQLAVRHAGATEAKAAVQERLGVMVRRVEASKALLAGRVTALAAMLRRRQAEAEAQVDAMLATTRKEAYTDIQRHEVEAAQLAAALKLVGDATATGGRLDQAAAVATAAAVVRGQDFGAACRLPMATTLHGPAVLVDEEAVRAALAPGGTFVRVAKSEQAGAPAVDPARCTAEEEEEDGGRLTVLYPGLNTVRLTLRDVGGNRASHAPLGTVSVRFQVVGYGGPNPCGATTTVDDTGVCWVRLSVPSWATGALTDLCIAVCGRPLLEARIRVACPLLDPHAPLSRVLAAAAPPSDHWPLVDALNVWLPAFSRRGWYLLYSARRDGHTAADFHKKCDGVQAAGGTLTLISTDEGYTFGGYTQVPWSGPPEPTPAADPAAFLFVLDGASTAVRYRRFGVRTPSAAVSHCAKYGPSFGADKELHLWLNGARTGCFGAPATYHSPAPGASTYPFSDSAVFVCEEVEVWAAEDKQ